MKIHELGRVGEHYAVYRLEQAGIQAIRVDREDEDIWARLPNKKIISVQVKSSSPFRPYDRTAHFRFYFRKKYSSYKSADVSVCVGVRPEEMNLLCIQDNFETEKRRDIRINEKFFNANIEKESIQRLIDDKPMKHFGQGKVQ
tara:strand:- start:4106 stop:4534 length:429 start_codon:yes stop_codon:yes gene_type:complete